LSRQFLNREKHHLIGNNLQVVIICQSFFYNNIFY